MRHAYQHEQEGSGLLSLLIAVAILAIIVIVMMQSFKNNMQVASQVQRKGELEDLRRLIRSSVNCEKTFSNQACSGGPLALLSAAGKRPVIAGTVQGSKIGVYRLTATCKVDAGSGARLITIAYEAESAAGAKDANSNKGSDLFKSVPFACPK